MADEFDGHATGLGSPASNAIAVTPNDSTDLSSATRALHLGAGGDVAVHMVGSPGVAVTFSGMAAGWHPIRVTRVLSTGTTATGIVGVW